MIFANDSSSDTKNRTTGAVEFLSPCIAVIALREKLALVGLVPSVFRERPRAYIITYGVIS